MEESWGSGVHVKILSSRRIFRFLVRNWLWSSMALEQLLSLLLFSLLSPSLAFPPSNPAEADRHHGCSLLSLEYLFSLIWQEENPSEAQRAMYCSHDSMTKGALGEGGRKLAVSELLVLLVLGIFLAFSFWGLGLSFLICPHTSRTHESVSSSAVCMAPPPRPPPRSQLNLLLLSLLRLLLCRPAGLSDLPMKHVSFLPVSTLTPSEKKSASRVDYQGSAYSITQQGKSKWL